MMKIGALLLVSGAMANANLFGTMVDVLSSINYKGHETREQLDRANIMMKNMKLPDKLQKEI